MKKNMAVGYFPYNIKSLQIITLQYNILSDDFPTFSVPTDYITTSSDPYTKKTKSLFVVIVSCMESKLNVIPIPSVNLNTA